MGHEAGTTDGAYGRDDLSGTFIDCAIFSVFPLDRLIHIALLTLQQRQDAEQ